MSWVKLDDQFYRTHVAGGVPGRALLLAGWCYCATNLTDGVIDKSAVPILLAEAEAPRKTIGQLLHLGWWEDRGDHYFDAEFVDTQRSRADIEGTRDAAQVRMETLRRSPERSREQHTNGSGERSATPVLSCKPTLSVKYDDDFQSLWAIYPRKKAKADASRAYSARRTEGITHEELMLSVKHYAADCDQTHREDQFVMHGSTFFGPRERWKDYLEPAKPSSNGYRPRTDFDALS